MKTMEERVKFLEGEYNRLYHTDELLSIYIPRLTAILIKILSLSYDWRSDVHGDLRGLKSFLTDMDKDIKEHYKSHYLDKKESYTPKRKTYKEYTNE